VTHCTQSILIEHDTVHGALLEELSRALEAGGHRTVRGDLTSASADVSILVTTSRGRVDAATMTALANLHTVVVPTTGIEAIDLEAASRLGVAVTNGATPQNLVSMAEATFLLILALLYRLPAVAVGWQAQQVAPPAAMLRGRTVGLIGYGGVAQRLVPRLCAFEAEVLVRSSRDGLQAPDVSFVSMPALLERSDVICVLSALNPGTRHLLSAAEFDRMKATAYLVNTARGGIVDEAALHDALASGRLAGAALDTFEREPLPSDSPLRSLRNVILTPHCIGHTGELSSSILPALIKNIEAARRGEIPPLCKNPQVRDRWRRLRTSS